MFPLVSAFHPMCVVKYKEARWAKGRMCFYYQESDPNNGFPKTFSLFFIALIGRRYHAVEE